MEKKNIEMSKFRKSRKPTWNTVKTTILEIFSIFIYQIGNKDKHRNVKGLENPANLYETQ